MDEAEQLIPRYTQMANSLKYDQSINLLLNKIIFDNVVQCHDLTCLFW